MIFYWHLSISNIIWLYKNTILSSWVLTGYTIYIFWIKWIKAFTTWIIFASFIKIVLILSWQSWFRTFIYFRLLQVLLTAKNVIYYVLTKMIRNSVGHFISCYQRDWILLLVFNSHHKIICSSIGERGGCFYWCIISIIKKITHYIEN